MQREMLRSCVSNWDIHIDETAIQVNGQMLGKSFSTIWSAGNAWLIDAMSFAVARKPEPGELEPQTEVLVSMGRRKSAPDYLLAVQVLQVYSRRVAALYEKFDILLTPTLGLPPLPLGSFDPTDEDPISGLRKAAEFCPLYTSIQCYRPAGNVGSASTGTPKACRLDRTLSRDSATKQRCSSSRDSSKRRGPGAIDDHPYPAKLFPMSSKTIAPYGTWKSPITADLIVQGAIGLTRRLDRW